MNNKRIIIGVTIGIIAAILWSVVFINVLNSMAGIGIGICLGISFGISGSLLFSKKDKDKWWYNFQFVGITWKMKFKEQSFTLFAYTNYRTIQGCNLGLDNANWVSGLDVRVFGENFIEQKADRQSCNSTVLRGSWTVK